MATTMEQPVAPDGPAVAPRPAARAPAHGPLVVAGIASLGAGAVHAVAVGSHADHPQAAKAFVALAVAQVAWGAVALVGRHRLVAVAGLLVHGAAVGGWLLAKTQGIGFVDGLDEVEGIQRADALSAALAVLAVGIALRVLVAGRRSRVPGRPALGVAIAALVSVSLLGMTGAGSHEHAGEEAGHSHGADEAADAAEAGSGDVHAHGTPAAVAAVPYDPARPIDLGGVEGVTPEQQARAENLVAITLARLPRYAAYETAEAAGYASIHDAATGHEHLINWAYLHDDQELNPDVPEALVYEVGPAGERTLVSAMFMLSTGTTLDEVPDLGGPLTQWHIHDDLCFSDDPVAPRVAGITTVGGECRPPTQKLDPVPMIHVWITKHPCGPFAALEGIGAGQVAEGETTSCDHAHGA